MGPREAFKADSKIRQAPCPVVQSPSVAEVRYGRLFETARDGILIIDADTGRIIDVNPFLENLLGYVRQDFIGKKIWEFGSFRDIRASRSAFEDLKRDGYIRYEHLPLQSKNGRRIEVEFISNLYQVGDKRTIQCHIRDISQRKQAEKVNRLIESKLRQAQKMTAIATLADGIAHQFNNALTVFTGGLDMLDWEDCYHETGRYLRIMKNAADKMSRMTRQLLAYARGGHNNLETISLSKLVSSSMPLLESAFKPSVVIEIQLPSNLPQIRVDRDQMQMVLIAILTNALEAIEKQGVIRISGCKKVMTDQKVKAFPGLRPGIYVSLTIRDNGKGMDTKTRDRVFEPFFTTHFPGRGLSMAAAFSMVKNHGGWISIESEVNKGTEVCIYLPASGYMEATTMASQMRVQETRRGASY